MQQSSSPAAESLLHLLLDRYEEPRARLRDITQRIDYRQIGGPAAQDDFHRVLQDAEHAGAIALEKERLGRFTGEYARVRLTNAEALYGFLVRSPAGTIADTARRSLESNVPHILEDGFFRTIADEALQAWGSNKSFLGLSVGDVDAFTAILQLTHGIMNLAGRDIDHRTFSRRIVKDSKALERCEGRPARYERSSRAIAAGRAPDR